MKSSNIDNPKYGDLNVQLRDDFYLSDLRVKSRFRNNSGYILRSNTNIEDFINGFKTDFEEEILPILNELKTITDCVNYYGDITFWGDHLKRIIMENNL